MSAQEEKKKKQTPDYEGEGRAMLLQAADRVLRGEKFSYDPDTDPAYRQYEKTYTRLGQRAMEDTLGQLSARTGGLAGSYAATAAQQSYQNHMAQLADKVPELRQLAYDMYRTERQDRLEGVELLGQLEGEAYDRWRDRVADYNDQRDYDRQVAQADRAYRRDVYESDRDFDRAVLESDRDYDRDVLQSQRDYELDVLKAGQTGKSGSGSGGKSGTGSVPDKPDWTPVQKWVNLYGRDSAEDYIREHYKDLGYPSVSTALAGWSNYNRQLNAQAQADQQRRARAAQGIVVNADGGAVDSVVVRAFNDLVEGGMLEPNLKATVEAWAKQGWYGLDGEGAKDLLATVGIYP